MDPAAKRILQVFDELGCVTLELTTLVERAGKSSKLGAPAEREAVRALVKKLVDEGLLSVAGAPESFARTEDGRLALAGPREVTFYTRPGCHLCDEAKKKIAPLLREYGAKLREVNIDAEPALNERYTNDVPVIFLGRRKVAKHRVNIEQFRRQLNDAPV